MSRDDFLTRWSRRKRTGDAAPELAPAVEAPEPEAAEADGRPDEEILAELGLVHPDRMAPGDDFAAFLRAKVPDHLRRKALRRLWRTDPTLACLDGLNDYDDDYRVVGVAEGGLRTAYEIGRGIVRRVAAAEPSHSTVDNPPEEGAADAANVAEQTPTAADPRPEDGSADAMPQGPTRRRMVFSPVEPKGTET